MELSQSRPFGTTEGRKATHDFLSLCSSTVHQDQASPQGEYLKTHDFLQPLEQVGKNVTKEENNFVMTAAEKPPSPHIPPSVEHLLPGGIGTYSISYFNQKILKPEGSLFAAQASNTIKIDESSNGSSYTGSGFSLWGESSVRKGKTGKENISLEKSIRHGMNVVGGQWPSLLEKSSQSMISNNRHKASTFSSFSSSQPSSSSQKNQTFMDMITSVKNDQEEDDDDEDEEFTIKRESSSHPKGNSSVNIEAKTTDHKPSTPRSKHSATEQRRRSKINDRFQKLREIIPNSDQKRDKASFLLEAIEYIQFLQEKVNKYESSYSIWNHEPSKMMQQRSCLIEDGFIDPSRGMNTECGPASLFATNFDENKAGVSPGLPPTTGQHLVESDISTGTAVKGRGQQPDLTCRPVSINPVTQTNLFTIGTASIAASPISPKEASHFLRKRSCNGPSDKLKEPELCVESGTISISSVFSQGLLNTLTQALQSSGVDLTQATISVQIDLGNRANGILNSSASAVEQNNVADALPRATVASTEEFDLTLKRPRTS